MKRQGNVMNKIIEINNLEKAYKKAKRGKNWYREVLKFEEDCKGNLLLLKNSLENLTYVTSEYEIFEKICGNKTREIYKLPFYPDRICQWAIMLQVESVFIKGFTKDTYSAIPKRGIHLALKRIKKELKKDKVGMTYCLKIDIKKYYPNIDHNVLKTKLKRLFKDRELLWLLSEIIDSLPNGKGLPIGNYTSQYLANFYLSDFDRWIKEEKKVRHFFRYMDDMIFFSDNKEDLHKLLKEIKLYITENLKLQLKGNEQVFPIDKRGVDFVGYVIYPTYIKLRKSIKTKMIYKMKKLNKKERLNNSDFASINSYNGWITHCDGINLNEKYLVPLLRKEKSDD